jgi:DNA-directed RNA polymerase specialized sigma24 family protein
MKFKDISKLLGITEEVAKKRSQRILKKLSIHYWEGEADVQNSQ